MSAKGRDCRASARLACDISAFARGHLGNLIRIKPVRRPSA